MLTPEFISEAPSSAFDQGWADYQAATEKMKDLQLLSAQLLANLEDLNSAAEAFNLADAHAVKSTRKAPVTRAAAAPTQADLQVAEERRAKRAETRAARKQPPPATSTSPSSPPPNHTSPSPTTEEQTLDGKKDWLERIMNRVPASTSSLATVTLPSATVLSLSPLPGPPATSTPVSVAEGVLERQLGQTNRGMAAGPSLSLVRPRSSDALDSAASSSMAKEANARRAGMNGRRAATATAAIPLPKKIQNRRRTSLSTDATSQFLNKESATGLLNGQSEKELTIIVKDLLFIEQVKTELTEILKREPTRSEWARALSMEVSEFADRLEVGRAAKLKMVQANHRLVISVSKKYQNKGLPIQDLITEGISGLLKGVEKFDPTKGFRFSTYAHWWIRQAVVRSVAEQGRTIRIPAHTYEAMMKIVKAKEALKDELGRIATMAEVSARTGFTAAKINEIKKVTNSTGTLDTMLGGGDDDISATRKDLVEDIRTTPDEALDEDMMRRDVLALLEELPPREAEVIRLRFGIDGTATVKDMTLEDIGVRFKVTRERIRQIESKAVRRLRQMQRQGKGILEEYAIGSAGPKKLIQRNSQGTNKQG